MKEIVKNTLILTCITLISGLLLGIAYDITKAPIRNQEEKNKKEAYATVFQEADSFEEVSKADLKKANDKLLNTESQSEQIDGIVMAKDKDGNQMGYVVTVTTNAGYNGVITLSVGIKDDGTVNGTELITLNETAGLGMEAAKDEFKNQFKNKKVQSFQRTKTGATKENEIDALSGATITTDAIVNSVNVAIACADGLKGDSGNE